MPAKKFLIGFGIFSLIALAILFLIGLAQDDTPLITGLDEYSHEIHTDYSTVTNIKYYSGIVFKGYIDGLPEAVLSGGQYSLGGACGLGFAVYLDALEGVSDD